MSRIYLILGMIIFLSLSACNTVRVSTDFDRNANFDQYQSFAFHQAGLSDLNMNDLDKRRVVDAVTQTLTAKGMTLASSENIADLVINISATNKTKVNVEPYYDPWWYGPYWGRTQRVSQYREGTLILDFIDRRQNTLVWQGVGAGLNVSDIQRKADKIPEAVQTILSKYPPQQ